MTRALVCGSLVALWAAVAGAQAPPPAPPQGRADVGRALYMKTGCAQCHGNEAQGGAAGPRLGPDAFPAARLQYIRKPAGDMPPYTAKVLSDRDLTDIFAFLQQRPRPPAVSSIPLLQP
jgi:ubiquinol-cytochrome c reductase cytochrome c subunit